MSTPGSYAFLSNPDDTSTVVTTYEALRDGTTTALLIHTSDADGASRADAYDAVEAGDTFEWRHVDDCWVRYIVEDVKPDPTGTAPRKLLALRWVTYTYSGCTGAIPSAGDRFMSWTPPAVQRPESGRMPAPVRHGPWLVMPLGWTGELQEVRYLGQRDPVEPSQVLHTTDIDEARREIPLWREPSGIPGTWTLGEVLVGGEVGPWSGFEASWESPKGRVIIIVVHSRWRKDHLRGVGTGAVMEMRRIGGHPAIVQYWPPEDKDSGTRVFLYDESTGIEVFVAAYSLELGETVAVALSLVDAHDPPTTSQPPVPATATPSPTPVAPGATTFRYDTYDTTGTVSTPGSYAFLSDPDDTSTAVTTYEALRDGTTTALLIHTSDAGGASRADVYDTVEVGDLFEWRQADDCFIRYTVTEVKPDPTGTVPRKLLAVEWMTYAFTGCSGAIPSDVSATLAWGELLDLGGTRLKVPIVHSIFQITPEDWDGPVEAVVDREPPQETRATPTYYDTIEEASNLPFWRTPTIPGGWILVAAGHGGKETPEYGYCSYWATEERDWHPPTRRWEAFDLCGYYAGASGLVRDASWNEGQMARETRVIAGRPAILLFSPPGPNHDQHAPLHVRVYDPPTRAVYWFVAWDYTLYGGNVEASLAIVTSLFADDGAEEDTPPDPAATTFRYDTYDTTGAVSTPGSYAFLSDPDDTSTVVATYEALRDGTTTALLVHTSDADGASRADVYDAVEAGDLFEWRQADDCFVRYTVTEVTPDPAGDVPRKLLAVEWMTYAYAGCSGAVSMDAAVGMTWGGLRDLGGVGLPAPVVHGTFHLAPENWEGKTKAGTHHDPPDTSPELEETSVDTLAAARAQDFPYWREPSTMPEGWELSRAWEGGLDAPWYGFCSVYVTNPRQKTINACGFFNTNRRFASESHYFVEAGLVARETRVIAGRPALILWSPPGPQYIWWSDVRIIINDPDTESSYVFIATGPGRSDLAADADAKLESVIAFVRTFFESAEEE